MDVQGWNKVKLIPFNVYAVGIIENKRSWWQIENLSNKRLVLYIIASITDIDQKDVG